MQEARSWTRWLVALAVVATPVTGLLALIGGRLPCLLVSPRPDGCWVRPASALACS
jgi:hypothetical protein